MKLNRIALSVIIAGMAMAASCKKDSPLAPNQSGNQENYVPGQLLIKFKSGDGSETKALNNTLATIGGEIVESLAEGTNDTSLLKSDSEHGKLLLVNTTLGTMEAIAKLQGSSQIEYAEPNYIYHLALAANETYYTNGSLWGMYGSATTPANTYGSRAGTAWAAGHVGISTVWVGLIDEGYMYTHEDLSANVGKNPGEIAGNGIDDDGNGYKDDVYGWDFNNNNNSVFDNVNDDHATHVAGTIGAKGNNGKGVAGINWTVKIMCAKVFNGANQMTTTMAIKATDYFTDLKKRHKLNLVATNNSWGGGGFSQSLKDAIERANVQGILYIAAAGNGDANGVGINNDATPFYPASYTNANVISVAAITSTGAKSGFSNYGATSVDIGAPGSNILSTVPKTSGSSIISGYAYYNGTSMATPHVTGAAALYASTHAGASAATIKSAILNAGIATASLNGKCVTGDRLNVGGF